MSGGETMGLPATLFVGGPGRSGTSFVADRLGAHPQVASFRDIELKLFCEKNGLTDLHHALCRQYSPNRGPVALTQFMKLAEALMAGRYGQAALGSLTREDAWSAAIARFAERLTLRGHVVAQSDDAFYGAARALLADIARLAMAQEGCGAATLFLEKTPHNLLALDHLVRIAPGARFLHVMRDPRSIAFSLLGMRWGPDRPETAAEWVASYCTAWSAMRARAADQGITVRTVAIEDLSTAPDAHAAALCHWLGLAAQGTLFAGASIDVLNRWTTRADTTTRTLLDTRLAGWVDAFGYDTTEIGQRRTSLSGGETANQNPETGPVGCLVPE